MYFFVFAIDEQLWQSHFIYKKEITTSHFQAPRKDFLE